MKTIRQLYSILTIISMLFVSQSAFSQCTLACFNQINLALDASGNATLTPAMVLAGIPPTCGTLVLSQTSFDCSDIGAPIIITVTDTDSGNSCWSEILIEDKFAPSIVCETNINVALSPDGEVTLTPGMLLASVSDNCPLTYSIVPPMIDCFDLGVPVNVVITATDPSGNFASCFTTVTATNYNPPPITCNALVNISLDATGQATILPEYLLAGSYPTCALALSQNSVDCSDIGTPVTVTVIDWLTANTCFTTVTVEDKLAPTPVCLSSLTVALQVDGTVTLFPSDLNLASFDNCTDAGNLTFSLSQSSFSCSDIGTPVNVELHVTDESGNSDFCITQVIIQDNTPPTPVCLSSIIASLGSDGTFTLFPSDVNLASFDNCTSTSNLTYSLSRTAFDCGDVGSAIPIELHVTDENGNTDFCITQINIQDNMAPVLSCNSTPTSIQLGPDGTVSVTSEMLLDAVSDNCDLTYTFSPAVFDCGDKNKTKNVTVTATDGSSNSATCTGSVFIEKPRPTSVDIIGPANIFCGESGAVFSSNVIGGYGPFTYDWSIKGNTNGWSITGGQGTPAITMNVGTNKVKLKLLVTDVCGQNRKNQVTFFCSNPALVRNIDEDKLFQVKQGIDLETSQNNNKENIVEFSKLGHKGILNIFPNPVMNNLELRIDESWNFIGSRLYIVDQLGVISKLSREMQENNYRDKLDVTELATGIYFLVVETKAKERIVKRFVKL